MAEIWKPETVAEKVKAVTDAIAANPTSALPLLAEIGEQFNAMHAKITTDTESITKLSGNLKTAQDAAFTLLQNKFSMGAPIPEGDKTPAKEKEYKIDALLRPDGLGLAI